MTALKMSGVSLNNFQKSILSDEMFSRGSAVSNIGGIIDFWEDISYEEFYLIINTVIKATPSLRLRLNRDGLLYETEETAYEIERIVKGSKEEAYTLASELIKKPFPSICDTDFFQFAFIEYEGGRAGFLKLHHLIGDAVSIVIICKKIDECFYKIRRGEAPVCGDVPVVYGSMTEGRFKKAAEYFGERLRDIPESRLAERESRDFRADRLKFSVPLYKKGMAGELSAALYIYISAVTGEKKVVIWNVLGNRRKSEMNMMAMFANTLPLVMEFGDVSFSEAAESISREMFRLMKYSAYSYEDLKKYNGVKGSIYEVSLSYKTSEFLPKIKSGEVIEFFNGCSDVPLRIFAEEFSDRLDFNIHYQTGAFDRAYIENMGKCLKSILAQGFEDRKISEIEVLSAKDIEAYIRLNSTEYKHRYNDVIECFKKNLKKNGEAVVWEKGSITGAELDALSDRAALYIKKKSAKIVGVRCERCPAMEAAVLGALKAGAAFMMVSDVIADMEKYCDIVIGKEDFEKFPKGKFPRREYDPESTAYMVWTSGSTGRPKCIEISRKSLMSRLEWADRVFGLRGSVLQKTVNTFDVAVWEMLCVVFGARCCLLPNGYEKMPDKTAEAMIKYKINTVHFVPSILNMFIKYVDMKGIRFPHLEAVFSSGEKLETKTVNEFYKVFDAELYNLYGPAECTIDVTGCKCRAGVGDVPIGDPADNTEIYILNSDLKVMPVGVWGEICIVGELVGKGYTGEDQGGYFSYRGKKAYRTGDIGRLGYDGTLYIRGRRDRQVKIRGMRINLSEVKNIVLGFEGIKDAEVIKNNSRVECYYCGDCDTEEVKRAILKRLHAYAVPSVFIKINEIPLTANGKADTAALTEYGKNRQTVKEELTKAEKEILTEVLKYTEAGVNDNLFEKGLDSLSILEIVCELQRKGTVINFSDFYEGLSVRSIAKMMNKRKYYSFIKNEGYDKVMVCFPYGGGEPQCFEKIVENFYGDVIGVYVSEFSAGTDIEKIAEKLAKELPIDGYEEVCVYGQCVGCMPALEFAERMGGRLKCMTLVSPAVKTERNSNLSPWKNMPDFLIKLILVLAGGKRGHYTKNVLDRFRCDTDRYFRYTPRHYSISRQCRVNIIYGDRDILVKNGRMISEKIGWLIGKPVEAYTIRGGKHYLNETHSKLIADVINNMI